MAKRQQQQNFLPSKALQPQQQIFDQYNAPKHFIAPRSELEDIGSALAGLSPTLQKFEDRNRAEDAAEMQIAASKMSLKELRAASKRDFIGLQKAGVIPEGASPWAKVALLEAAGKRLAGEARKTLYAKLPELSQIGSTLTVDQVLQEFSDANGIDSIYAATAYNETIQPIRNAFENRVGEAIAQRTAQQNSDDIVDTYSEIFMGFTGDTSEDNQATWSSIRENMDAYKSNTGAPGHKELLKAAEAHYLNLLEDTEEPEHATDFLNELRELQIGTASFGHTYRIELGELEDKGLTKLEADRRRKNSTRLDKENDIKDSVNTVMSKYWIDADKDTKSADPFGEKSEAAIMAALKPEFTSADGTVDTEELNKATIAGMEYVAGLQRQQTEDVDWELSGLYLKMSYDPNVTPEQLAAFLEANGDKIAPSYKASVDRDSVETRKLTELMPGLKSTILGPPMEELEEKYVALGMTGLVVRKAKREVEKKINAKFTEIALEELKKVGAAAAFDDPTTVITNITDRFGPWMDQQIESVTPVEKPAGDLLRSYAPSQEGDATGRLVEMARAHELKARPKPLPDQLIAKTKATVWDSEFTNKQQDFQAIARDTSLTKEEKIGKRKELIGEVWQLAKGKYYAPLEVQTDYDFGNIRRPGKYRPWVKASDYNDLVRAKSIVLMASLTELRNKEPADVVGEEDKVIAKWGGDTYKVSEVNPTQLDIIEEGGGQVIPKELLDPSIAVFVSDENEKPLESAEALKAFKMTPEGNQMLSDIYDALILANPDAAVGFEKFYKLQYTLLKRKREH